MIEDIDNKILSLYSIYKKGDYDIDKLFIDIHELICSYKTPIISYKTYNVEELKSYIKYKNAWEELKTLAPIYFICSRMEKIEQKHNISKEME